MRKIYIAYTGGTIGMAKTNTGFSPVAGYLEEKINKIEELKSREIPDFDFNEYDNLLDSANIKPRHWRIIAEDIAEKRKDYDGFVILHGTDTMAYTASAIAFLLQGIGKPVIITGSQIPFHKPRNDARNNLLTAIILAGYHEITEVCLYFGGILIRGCRSVKVKANSFHAFASPNFPVLGTVGVNINLNEDLFLKNQKEKISLRKVPDYSIATLQIFPGISAKVLENILKPPLKGLVLQTYGMGNLPQDNRLLDTLKKAVNNEIVIVACTQNLSGKVQLDTYEPGHALANTGVISGFDMTIEAALAKLYYLFSLDLSNTELKESFQKNLCGEIST